MDIPTLTHVRVNVLHLAASLDWYERMLGVTAQRPWPPQDPTYVHFNVGPAQYALGRYEPAPATGARFNFEVDDVDEGWRRLSQGVDVAALDCALCALVPQRHASSRPADASVVCLPWA